MVSVKRYQVRTAAAGVLMTAAAAFPLWMVSPTVAQGILLGGLAATAGFWMLATRVAELAYMPRNRVALEMYMGVALRLTVYGVALLVAYLLDRENLHALLGAAGTIVALRTVLVFTGLVGVVRRLRNEQPGS